MRRLEIPALLLSLVAAAAGCDVGEVPAGDGGGGSNDPGEASFNAMIAPLVTECVMGGCHSVQAPILTSYGALAAKYKVKPGASNILVTKGDMEATPGTHSGLPYFSESEKMTVAAWIDSLP